MIVKMKIEFDSATQRMEVEVEPVIKDKIYLYGLLHMAEEMVSKIEVGSVEVVKAFPGNGK